MSRLAFGAACLWLLGANAHAHAQAARTKHDAANQKATLQRITTLETELARQQAELQALREELGRVQAANQEPPPSAAASAPSPPDDKQALAEILSNPGDTPPASPEAFDEPLLRFYGVADVGLQRMWADRALAPLVSGSDKSTFVLGNLNLYLDAKPSKDFRFLAEIRFGTFPNGATSQPKGGLGAGPPIDTTISDSSAANPAFTSLKWAGISPQRAHVDWTPSDLFNLRAGLFLTPYGIWNVDHGTPTRIMVSEPLFMTMQLVPSQLLGIEAFGTVQVLPWTIGYHAHISNGRTIHQIDFSDNKAFGGRLFASTRYPFPIKLGVSGYVGDSEDATTMLGTVSRTFSYTEYAVSGDLSLDIGALRVRSEVVAGWNYYKDGLRRTLAGVPMADILRMGGYIVLAYQLPWYGIEPLIMAEFLRYPVPRSLPVGEGMIMPAVGVNVYFTSTTMLRTQFAMLHGYDTSAHPVKSEGFMYQAVARLITAF